MLTNRTIQLIAFSLLAILGLNLLLSFACAIGLNKDLFTGKPAEFKIALANEHHGRVGYHPHEKHLPATKVNQTDVNCCSGEVDRFTHIEKSLPQGISIYF